MSRGFIKEVGDHRRHRIVLDGYDADNMATPPNKVVFDTDDLGTLSVIDTGSVSFTSATSATPVKIASWSLSYAPLCTFQFSIAGGNGDRDNGLIIDLARPVPAVNFKITVDTTGIYVCAGFLGSGAITIHYQAYRLVAA